MSKPRVIGCEIQVGGRWEPNTVVVSLDDGRDNVYLFMYYPDEISFSEDEFIGLTEDQAYRLRFDRDVAYLRS